MALTIGDNFSYQGVKPLDGRIKYNTLAEMVAMADSTLYDGCIAYCVGEDKNYQWKSTNTVDSTTGKWRELEAGGGSEYTAGDGIDITNDEISTERMQSSEIGDLALSEPGIIPDVKITRPVVSTMDRWLRFDPDNKKGLIIKGNTYIRNSQGNYVAFYTDTAIDLTSSISTNGADYFVNMADNGTITASTSKFSTGVTIGRFHTLCVAAGTISMIAPASPNSGLTTNSYYLIKSYSETDDPDFYSFYRKKVTAISANASHYDVVTMSHPLSGFAAGSILPESVFCLTFHPECLVEDAMVYDKDTNRAIDIYLQSGTAQNTRSKYNATHTVSRTSYNHAEDYRSVGKRLLLDNEFTSAALGSNECTGINGAADATYVGGHKDTNNRRMISAIGCEEMCGYLWQWLADLVGNITTNQWLITDGRGSFGQEYWQPYVLKAGGCWTVGVQCGSRARASANVRSAVIADSGGRGSSRMSRNT